MDSRVDASRVSDEMTYIQEFDALLINLEISAVSKYPAKQHARSVAEHLGAKEGLLYLLGRPSTTIEDSDQPEPFRQRRYFYYLTGADFEDCIVTYDIKKDILCLFIPQRNPLEVIWIGPTPSTKECEEKYDVDLVLPTSVINNYIVQWLQGTEKPIIYILHQTQAPKFLNLDVSSQEILRRKKFTLDWTLLKRSIEASRVIKSDYEVGLIRRANDITSHAHRGVLANLARFKNETHIEAMFTASCIFEGAKKQAYGIIAGSGENASILHYVANDQPLQGRQLVCLDAGCEWQCYASDVTRTFPISGTFSKEAREIYDIVAEMQDECIKRVKPGVYFRDLHVLAQKIAVQGLMRLGLLHNGTFAQIMNVVGAFFPHGLGHHLGLECHDVSDTQRLLAHNMHTTHDLQRFKTAIPPPSSILTSKPYNGRQVLAKNMVITVEPGIYFSRYALEHVYLRSPGYARYINRDLLEKYYPVGGVRIEDDILVTSDGYENLTTAPKGEEACRIIRGESREPSPR